ncbi:MAG: type II toxin-antitoxin system HicB family antitoxin [Bacteroidetes bacterium]|nr:type II toxin-antitoxin system HicB family antitoxin [Bacteroidota bacterium]MCL2303539.1 type II toxin-antitoxin system HicB family antitoxin [Lentimicrobiaceae bacterium]
MDNVLRYKNFIATVKYSAEDEAFIGRIEGINSVVSFEGQSVEELKSAFHDAVESYLDFCKRKGITDYKKSYTGKFNVRINSDTHRRASITAKLHGKTLNSFVKEAIERYIEG